MFGGAWSLAASPMHAGTTREPYEDETATETNRDALALPSAEHLSTNLPCLDVDPYDPDGEAELATQARRFDDVPNNPSGGAARQTCLVGR